MRYISFKLSAHYWSRKQKRESREILYFILRVVRFGSNYIIRIYCNGVHPHRVKVWNFVLDNIQIFKIYYFPNLRLRIGTHFLRFWPLPPTCQLFFWIGLWSNVTFWQIPFPPKWLMSFMHSLWEFKWLLQFQIPNFFWKFWHRVVYKFL